MLRAALWSRCRLVPQSGHACQRTDKPLCTSTPQPEQAWLVYAGGTATTVFPAAAACCRFARQDAQERTPARIADALGQVIVLDHVGRLQVFVIDRVVLPEQLQGEFVMEILPLSSAILVSMGLDWLTLRRGYIPADAQATLGPPAHVSA